MFDVDMRNQHVQAILGLNPEDIEANRRGKVSQQQADRINAQRGILWRGLALIYILPLLLPAIMSLVFLTDVVFLLSGVFAISWTIGFVRAALNLRTRQNIVTQDVVNNNVQAVEGEMWLDTRNQGAYTIGVGNTEFIVQKRLYEALTPDELVALYYLGTSQKLLSIEYVHGPFIAENMTV